MDSLTLSSCTIVCCGAVCESNNRYHKGNSMALMAKILCGIKLPSERFQSHNPITPCIFSNSAQNKQCLLGKPPNLCLQSQSLQMKAICNGKRYHPYIFISWKHNRAKVIMTVCGSAKPPLFVCIIYPK